MISKPYEDIAVGDHSVTGERVIDGEYVREFADLTWDRHPLHLDEDYAARSRFGRNIAHGALMVSTLLGLVELNPRYLQCFYGMDRLRFTAPAYIGDIVHAESTVVSISPSGSGGSAVVSCEAKLKDSDGRELLSGEFSMLVASRDNIMAVPEPSDDGLTDSAKMEVDR